MKTRIHRRLSELIREGCEGRLNVQINPRWFSAGNVYPDCTHQRLLHLHELDSAGRMVERMIRRFCRRGVDSRKILSRWRSLRLGIISHYICDFMCYAHTASFNGTLREHRSYEAEQGQLSPRPAQKEDCDFYGTQTGAEVFRQLQKILQERELSSYSPAEDLDYAASAGTQIACAILRLCLEHPVRPAVWKRLSFFSRRLIRAA